MVDRPAESAKGAPEGANEQKVYAHWAGMMVTHWIDHRTTTGRLNEKHSMSAQRFT